MNRKLLLFAVACMFTATTFAQSGDCGANGSNLTWTLTGYYGDKTLTISGTGDMANYLLGGMVPWSSYRSQITTLVIDEGVTSIGHFAFWRCIGLTGTLTIPNSVTAIGTYAFMDCSSVTSVTIGNSVTSIGDYAFRGCSSLTSITIPNSVTAIGSNAFWNCSGLIGELTIPNSVTSIGSSAFRDCSGLTGNVTIPNSVTSIGVQAFYGCSSLTSINVDENNPNYSSEDGVLFNKNKTTLIYCLTEKTGTYIIPNSVTAIGKYAFWNCNGLTELTIPNSITSIGMWAFDGCSGLTSIIIPNLVSSIGDDAFRGCSRLISISSLAVIPPTLGGSYVFAGVPTDIPVYVPCGSIAAYIAAGAWSAFTNYQCAPTSINNANANNISISPNPARDFVTIDGIQSGETVTIIDLQGRTVLSAQTATINVSALPQGVYLVRVGNNIAKLIKE
ncbi:MAG: leucine-rich repeat protein [Prevotellaceae bacterium]|jgi:hypothetical protein|nr:leucine-rich repeat protein [Prevotellaceae bacterium]